MSKIPTHDGSALSPVVVRFGAFGDLVLLTPLLHLLHRRYGRPCTVVTSGAWAQPLLHGHPDVESILQLRSRRRPYLLDPQQWRLTRALRQLPDGPVYVCDEIALDKVRALLARGGMSAHRCVYVSDLAMGRDQHWVDRWLRFGCLTPTQFDATAFGWRDEDLVAAPLLHVSAADREDCADWLRARAFGDGPMVLLQPGNKRTLKRGRLGTVGDDKHWPTPNWARLCHLIVARLPRAQIVLCGTPREIGLLEDIRCAAALSQVHIAAEDLPVRRLLALLECAHSMISIDTGPAHAAAAMGCPLVVLYGAASPLNWVPRSSSGSPVAALASPGGSGCVADIAAESVGDAWTKSSPMGPK